MLQHLKASSSPPGSVMSGLMPYANGQIHEYQFVKLVRCRVFQKCRAALSIPQVTDMDVTCIPELLVFSLVDPSHGQDIFMRSIQVEYLPAQGRYSLINLGTMWSLRRQILEPSRSLQANLKYPWPSLPNQVCTISRGSVQSIAADHYYLSSSSPSTLLFAPTWVCL